MCNVLWFKTTFKDVSMIFSLFFLTVESFFYTVPMVTLGTPKQKRATKNHHPPPLHFMSQFVTMAAPGFKVHTPPRFSDRTQLELLPGTKGKSTVA